MDYKKSYTLLWVGLIAGFVLMLIGVFLEIGWLLWPGPKRQRWREYD